MSLNWRIANLLQSQQRNFKHWSLVSWIVNQSFKWNVIFTHMKVRTTGSDSFSLLWYFCRLSLMNMWFTANRCVMLYGEGGAWLLVWSRVGRAGRAHTAPRISQTCSCESGPREEMSCSQDASFLDCCTLCVQCIYLELRTYIRHLSTRPLSLYRNGDSRQNKPL